MDTSFKPIKKIDIKATLLQIPVGNSIIIKTKTIKPSSLRSAIRTLNNEGYFYECTERGLADEVKIRRNK